MAGALGGMRILVPESRELDLFASMLEAEGAQAFRCPLVHILDLEDTREAEAWVAGLVAGEFQDVIWLTGEGLRRLLGIAERQGSKAAFLDAIKTVRSITRGPKPARALREFGLSSWLAAAAPTSQGVMDALAAEDISGRRIAVQLYPGNGALPLLASLRDRGATVFPVIPYRYGPEAEAPRVVAAIRELYAGRIDMIAFTSSPQVDRLLEVAQEAGLEKELRASLSRMPVAAIGPVVEERLRELGLTSIVRPASAFHLKPLVRAIAASKDQGSKH